MTTKIEALLAEVARLDAEATPGPWKADVSQLDDVVVWAGEGETPGLVMNVGEKTTVVGEVFPRDSANGVFVARARTLLPELARIVALQRRALERVPLVHLGRCAQSEGFKFSEAARAAQEAEGCTNGCHVALVRAALAGEEETR